MAYREWTAPQWIRTHDSTGFAVEVEYQYRQDLAEIKTEVRVSAVRLLRKGVYGFQATLGLGAGIGDDINDRELTPPGYVDISGKEWQGAYLTYPLTGKTKEFTHGEDGSAPQIDVWGYFYCSAAEGSQYDVYPPAGWLAASLAVPGFDLTPGEGSANLNSLDNGTASIRYSSTKACDIIQYKIGDGAWVTTGKTITEPGGYVVIDVKCPIGSISTIYLRHKIAEISATSTPQSVRADFTIPTIQVTKPEEEGVSTAALIFQSSADCKVWYSTDQRLWKSPGSTTDGRLRFLIAHPEPERAYVLYVYGAGTANNVKTERIQLRIYPLVDQLRVRQPYGGEIRVARVWYNDGSGEIKKVKYGFTREGDRIHKISNSHEPVAQILTQPTNQIGYWDQVVTFEFTITGTGYELQWQMSKDGVDFIDIQGETSTSYSYMYIALPRYRFYRCKITPAVGETLYTDVVKVSDQSMPDGGTE